MKLTGKQCKASRALLKWNLHDLTSRTHVIPRRVESFEKGMCHLYPGENKELIDIFKKHGVQFLSDFEACLADDAMVSDVPMVMPEGIHVTLDADDLLDNKNQVYVASDSYVGPDRRADRRDAPPPEGGEKSKSPPAAPEKK